ncbi:MAG: hypothetical protein J6Q51_01015 [Clostridia bacterium]|nr:hypothetical protein [Clostridia bacterium]
MLYNLLNVWNEFVEIFVGELAWLTITLMVVGIVLCLVEAIVPGFGIFGVTGIACEIASVIVHAVLCKGSAVQIILLVVLITLITVLIFLIFVRSARYGLLGKTPIVENKTAIPVNYGQKDIEKLKTLIGKEGITTTECRPIGKMRINEDVYEVCSKNGLINKNEVVKITEVEDAVIYVAKISY